MTKYAKIEDGVFVIAPKKVKYKNKTVTNPNERILKELGYMEVIDTITPDTPENVEIQYSIIEDKIYITYVVTAVEDENENKGEDL